jgi:hypothetical protein
MRAEIVDFLSHEPNWLIVTLLGALLGAVVGSVSIPAGRLRARKRHRVLVGTWHECHFTLRHGQVILGRATVIIEPSLRAGLRAVVDQQETHPDGMVTDLSYTGQVRREGHLVLALTGRSHDETLVLRYLEHLPSNTAPMVGLWSSQDHDCLPASGVSALSRTKLTDEQARQLLSSRVVSAHGVIRVAPSGARAAEPQASA